MPWRRASRLAFENVKVFRWSTVLLMKLNKPVPWIIEWVNINFWPTISDSCALLSDKRKKKVNYLVKKNNGFFNSSLVRRLHVGTQRIMSMQNTLGFSSGTTGISQPCRRIRIELKIMFTFFTIIKFIWWGLLFIYLQKWPWPSSCKSWSIAV